MADVKDKATTPEEEEEDVVEQPQEDDVASDSEEELASHIEKLYLSQEVCEVWGRWGAMDANQFRVRGQTYLDDRKKVPAGKAVFELAHVELLHCEERLDHIAEFKENFMNTRANPRTFYFVFNLQTPAATLVMYWGLSGNCQDNKFNGLLRKFVKGTDEFRTARFKFLPVVAQGAWVVKKAVGHVPTLLATKVPAQWFLGKNYLEVDTDIQSNGVACGVLAVASGATKGLVIDLAVILQGENESELPERVLGAIRLSHIHMDRAIDSKTVYTTRITKAAASSSAAAAAAPASS